MRNLRRIREEKGISQEKIGEVVGVTGAAVCQWESGKSHPQYQRLVKLAQYLSVSIDELIEDTNIVVVVPEN